jgi:branched-chain amino acid transport system substrate-binding protein
MRACSKFIALQYRQPLPIRPNAAILASGKTPAIAEHGAAAMVSRRSFMQGSAAVAAYFISGAQSSRSAIAPGVTDTEIKFGQSMPYSGPASSYSIIGRTEAAYFRMINENGGVNGRQLNFVSVDDSYSPPKTVEQTRRLVEQEQVACIFGTLGGVTNLAIRQYLNEQKIPQLFCASGADQVGDPHSYPWTMGLNPAVTTEAHMFAKQILATKPEARIGLLFQNDSMGKGFQIGLPQGLGAEHAAMMVKAVSYEVSDPTVDSQILSLQDAGVDTLVIGATPKAAAQAIRKVYDIGWTPDRYLFDSAASIQGTLKPAGLDKSKGLISAGYQKDPNDVRWKDDPGFLQWSAFASKYLSPDHIADNFAVYAYGAAMTMVQVFKQCGDDLSRENIMRQATNIKDFEWPMGLPGMRLNTSPENYYPIRQLQLARFNGESWEFFGEMLSD